MRFRPHPAHAWLLLVLAIPCWRLYASPPSKGVFSRDRVGKWARLATETPEEIERGVASRYRPMVPDLKDVRDVGYFADKDHAAMWAESSSPLGHARIERYYMAQSILAPALLRFDKLRAKVVVDCESAGQAVEVVRREGLEVVRDYGNGLILAKPEG